MVHVVQGEEDRLEDTGRENKAETKRKIGGAKKSVEATTVWGTQRMKTSLSS